MRWGNVFRRNSITFRQTRLVFLAALVVGCLVFLVEAVLLASFTRENLAERQEQILALAERPATAAIWEFNERLAQETIAGVMHMSDVRQVVIVHPDGMPFASMVREKPLEPTWKRGLARIVVGGHERIVRPLRMRTLDMQKDVEEIGSLIVIFNEAEQVDLFINVLSASLLVTLLGAFLIVAVIAVVFDRFLTRPILSISRQVEGVDAEDPQGRMLMVPKFHAESELGLAVQKINAMLIHLGNAQHALRRMATRDATTNLPNRTLTIEHLVGVARRAVPGKVVAVLAVLMDRLDELKDLIGHEEADEMAMDMAVRLLDSVGAEAFIGRIGVDSFAVVIEDLDTATAAVDYANGLLENLTRVEFGCEKAVRPSVCVGIALFPNDGTEAADLLRKAVVATAGARRKANQRWNFFEDGLAEGAHRRLLLESQLHQALEAKEFVLYFQPQMSRTGEIVGAEALVRWCCDGQVVPPGAFIPVAEDCGLVVPIGDFVMDEACRASAQLRRAGLNLTIAVNVSPQQLADPGFVPRVVETLSRHGVSPDHLEIEITEYTLAMERGALVDRIRALRERGIRIALDDFGTGYSSLSYLRRFPVDVLKIDRSFVTDLPNDVAVPSTILTLAQKLGMSCVAEGIETEAQRDWMVNNGCDVLQGYLFARPMPLDDFMKRYVQKPPGGNVLRLCRESHVVDG
ncbi:MAG: EAL domain-containing protein [Rhodospirillaceae bacterium]|nr:EAL domain-containing protein [Rhodospirillaceae bacterium]